MSRAKPVNLGHLNFPNQKEAKAYFKDLLNRYKPISTLNEMDSTDVMALLSGHTNAKEKIGTGIAYISVDSDDLGGQCFHINREDGSKENFSYIKCISGQQSQFTRFSIACRRSIDDELYEFKKTCFSAEKMNAKYQIQCPVTKSWITWDQAHVDHKAPMTFSVIVSTFIQMENIDLDNIAFDSTSNYGNEFTDETIGTRFATWHRKNATLRVIQANANLSNAFMGRVKPTQADRKLL